MYTTLPTYLGLEPTLLSTCQKKSLKFLHIYHKIGTFFLSGVGSEKKFRIRIRILIQRSKKYLKTVVSSNALFLSTSETLIILS